MRDNNSHHSPKSSLEDITYVKRKIVEIDKQIDTLYRDRQHFMDKLQRLDSLKSERKELEAVEIGNELEQSAEGLVLEKTQNSSDLLAARQAAVERIKSLTIIELKKKMKENGLKLASKEKMVTTLIRIWDAEHPDKTYTPSRWGMPPSSQGSQEKIKVQKLECSIKNSEANIRKAEIEYEKLFDFVVSDLDLLEDILLFRTFELSEFTEKLNKNHILVSKKNTKNFLDKNGVSFSIKRNKEEKKN